MGTFLTPSPSFQPIFAAPADDDSDLFYLALHAMYDDVGAHPQPAGSFAADATTLPTFFVHEQDQHDVMPFPPPIFVDPAPALSPSASGRHGFLYENEASTSRPAKRRRRLKMASSPCGSGGDSSGPAAATTRPGRRVWVRERSTEWWDRLSGASCPEAEFRRAFRMSRATFDALCDELRPAVAREDTALRAAVPARQRVAVCLSRLATGDPLREVSRRFGLGVSTCHSIILQVCAALTTVLMPRAIRWPDAPAAADVASRFEAASRIPGIVGAVCTTHVPIVAPNANVAAYYNRRLTERNQKASYSVAVQVVSDADGAFTDVFIGLPGSLSDAAVLGRSALCARRGEVGLVGVGEQQQRLVGGTSYPLMDWMLVPYAHRNLTWAQHEFNKRVAAAHSEARGAIWRLKARWRCLQRRTEVKMQDLLSMIGACCVLHNVCERAGEGLDPDLMNYELDHDVVAHNAVPSAASAQARDRIAHDLLHGSHADDRA
ncbi:protein ALP1-like [Phragmites australis]|uniref:protein ALP1-like n=1 Tax=Phragmites australis TaxID=29695 RepID=UPI002D76E23F|nr:protein ALP1-like [Phragmites australis]